MSEVGSRTSLWLYKLLDWLTPMDLICNVSFIVYPLRHPFIRPARLRCTGALFFPAYMNRIVLNWNPQVVERGPSIDLVVETTVDLASHRSMQRSYGGGGGGVVDWKRAIGNSQPAPPMKR